jgi:hypothetical protein
MILLKKNKNKLIEKDLDVKIPVKIKKKKGKKKLQKKTIFRKMNRLKHQK